MLHGQQTRVKVKTSRSPDVTSNTCWQWDLLCKSLTTGVFRRCFPRKLRSPRDTLALSPPRTLLFPRHGDQQHTVVCRAEFKLQVRKKNPQVWALGKHRGSCFDKAVLREPAGTGRDWAPASSTPVVLLSHGRSSEPRGASKSTGPAHGRSWPSCAARAEQHW